MKLNQLRAMVCVANCGSIQEAAKTMHVTQPAISKAIRELERELGVSLLIRSVKGATLSPYGAAIVRRARAIQKELVRIDEDIGSLRGTLAGNLAIGVTPPVASIALAEATARFFTSHPTVELQILEMRVRQIGDGLRDGLLDLGLVSCIGEPRGGGHQWTRLYSLPNVVATGKAHAPAGPVPLAKLRRRTWLSLDPADGGTSFAQHVFTANGLSMPERVIHCSSIALYRQLATRIDAVSTWSEGAFKAVTASKVDPPMARIALVERLPPLDVWLTFQDSDLLTKTATDFIHEFRKQLALLDHRTQTWF